MDRRRNQALPTGTALISVNCTAISARLHPPRTMRRHCNMPTAPSAARWSRSRRHGCCTPQHQVRRRMGSSVTPFVCGFRTQSCSTGLRHAASVKLVGSVSHRPRPARHGREVAGQVGRVAGRPAQRVRGTSTVYPSSCSRETTPSQLDPGAMLKHDGRLGRRLRLAACRVRVAARGSSSDRTGIMIRAARPTPGSANLVFRVLAFRSLRMRASPTWECLE